MSGIGFGNTSDFFSSEFVDIDLRDKRLEKRALTIFNALQRELTSCVRRLFKNGKDMRQAYDFFSNPKVSSAALLEPHYLKTAERVAACDCKYILAIQDDTLLNYTSHKAKTEIGRIEIFNKNNSRGEGRSTHETAADLIHLNEIRELPNEEQFVFVRGYRAIKCKKTYYFKEPYFKGIAERNPLEFERN